MRKNRHYVGARVSAREQATVDYACKIKGVSRSDYVREIVLTAAERDVRQAVTAVAED